MIIIIGVRGMSEEDYPKDWAEALKYRAAKEYYADGEFRTQNGVIPEGEIWIDEYAEVTEEQWAYLIDCMKKDEAKRNPIKSLLTRLRSSIAWPRQRKNTKE